MATLLEIGAGFAELADLLDGLDGGEVTPETEAALDQWFAELCIDQATKVDGYLAYSSTLRLRAAARREEAERLMKRVRVDEAADERLLDRLKDYMESTQQKVIETRRYRVSVMKNGGKVGMIVPEDARLLPTQYRRTETVVKPETDMIRAALEKGEQVEGCSLKPRGTRLSIK